MRTAIIYDGGSEGWSAQDVAAVMANVREVRKVLRRAGHDVHLVPVRLGDINEQTRWVLGRAGAGEPEFLPHVMLRVSDVMRREFPQAGEPLFR